MFKINQKQNIVFLSYYTIVFTIYKFISMTLFKNHYYKLVVFYVNWLSWLISFVYLLLVVAFFVYVIKFLMHSVFDKYNNYIEIFFPYFLMLVLLFIFDLSHFTFRYIFKHTILLFFTMGFFETIKYFLKKERNRFGLVLSLFFTLLFPSIIILAYILLYIEQA